MDEVLWAMKDIIGAIVGNKAAKDIQLKILLFKALVVICLHAILATMLYLLCGPFIILGFAAKALIVILDFLSEELVLKRFTFAFKYLNKKRETLILAFKKRKLELQTEESSNV